MYVYILKSKYMYLVYVVFFQFTLDAVTNSVFKVVKIAIFMEQNSHIFFVF